MFKGILISKEFLLCAEDDALFELAECSAKNIASGTIMAARIAKASMRNIMRRLRLRL